MPGDPYYQSPAWRALAAACKRRDGHRCTVPGCGRTDRLTANHVVPRSEGGPDVLDNLVTLCPDHDNQFHREKGGPAGAERGRGMIVRGTDAAGRPRDPSHPWHRPS